MRVFVVLSLIASFIAPLRAEETKTCGVATYSPSEYTCYNDSALCPTVYSLPTVPCSGSGGCYAPQAFSCEGGTLKTLPKASSPFTLTAYGTRRAYRGLAVKACGSYLAIGANARECTSCTKAAPGVQCSSYKGKTVFLPGGAMVNLSADQTVPTNRRKIFPDTLMFARRPMSLGVSIGMSTRRTVRCSSPGPRAYPLGVIRRVWGGTRRRRLSTSLRRKSQGRK